MSFSSVSSSFPSSYLLPKSPTEVSSFLSSYPAFDGRGVLIAILDTGCDVSVPGLQTTSDGRPKFIDSIDCTGDGDVAMSDSWTKPTEEDWSIRALSGRRLLLNRDWPNPTGQFRLGVKRYYDILPEEVRDRSIARKKKEITEKQNKLESSIRVKQRQQKSAPSSDESESDLAVLLKELSALSESSVSEWLNRGPLVDVLLFHDGAEWRVLLSLADQGPDQAECDLRSARPLREYRLGFDWLILDEFDQQSVSISVIDEGATVSLVASSGSHGTHVAAITAAHFPARPELNGVAPGAQLLSLKIGDNRLSAMEQGQALQRALIAAERYRVDLINMSFGESYSIPQLGRWGRAVSDLVQRSNLLFVCSAGNNGPGLQVCSYPGGCSDATIPIGAYVNPNMIQAMYAQRKEAPESPYSWSSRGPAQDGGRGVSVVAAGAAITCVPRYCQQGVQLCNGTSMSAPAAAGALALLVSALKSLDMNRSVRRIRQAIEATAAPLPAFDGLSVGSGLLQVEKAFDHLKRYQASSELDFHFDVSIAGGTRGIVIRSQHATQQPVEATITITPTLPEPKNEEEVKAYNSRLLSLQLELRLERRVCWVECASHLLLPSQGRSFTALVKTPELEPGLHYTEISGIDTAQPDKGPLFTIPVTVIIPERTPLTEAPSRDVDPASFRFTDVRFVPGTEPIQRRFFTIPFGCSYARVRIRSGLYAPSTALTRSFYLHSLYFPPHISYKDREWDQFISLRSLEEREFFIDLHDGAGEILEFTVALAWSQAEEAALDIAVQFCGLAIDRHQLALSSAEPAHKLDIKCVLGFETIEPLFHLTHQRTVRRPENSEITPLGERDHWQAGHRRISRLTVQYSAELKEDSKVTFRIPLLQDFLYESLYEGCAIQVLDSRAYEVAFLDAWPKPIQLKKGKYSVKLHVRHDQVPALERLKDLALHVETQLSKPIELAAFPSLNAAIEGSGRIRKRRISPGTSLALWIAMPEGVGKSAALAAFKTGDCLVGQFRFHAHDHPSCFKDPRKPTFSSANIIKLHIQHGNGGQEAAAQQSSEQQLDVQNDGDGPDLELEYVLARGCSAWNRFGPRLVDRYPLNLKLRKLELEAAKKRAKPEEIVNLCDSLLGLVDEPSVALTLCRPNANQKEKDKEKEKERKQKTDEKEFIIFVLQSKLSALESIIKCSEQFQWRASDGAAQNNSLPRSAEFFATFSHLSSWLDLSSKKPLGPDYWSIAVFREELKGNIAQALKLLNSELASEGANGKSSAALRERRLEVIESIGAEAYFLREIEQAIINQAAVQCNHQY